MYKIIILILCSFLLSINCEGYRSSELANLIRNSFNLYAYYLFDIDDVLNSNWLQKFKNSLEDIYSEGYREPYLIIVNELDYSGVGENNFMSDFTERLISSNERKKKTILLLYCINDETLYFYLGDITSLKSEDVEEPFNENKEKYDDYLEIIYHTLDDIHDKLVKNAIIVLVIIFVVIAVGVGIGILIYCFYCKRKKKGQVHSNYNDNNNQIIVQQNPNLNGNNLQNEKQMLAQPNPNMNVQNQMYVNPSQNMNAYNVQGPIVNNQLNNQIPVNQNYNSMNPGINNQQNVGYSSHNF
jgi:hypothetical protein